MRNTRMVQEATPPITPAGKSSGLVASDSPTPHSALPNTPSTPSTTPIPLRLNISIDAPNADGTSFEASIKYQKPHQQIKDEDPFQTPPTSATKPSNADKVNSSAPKALPEMKEVSSLEGTMTKYIAKTSAVSKTCNNQPPPYRDPRFQTAIRDGVDLADKITRVIGNCPKGLAPQRLLEEASKLSKYKAPVERLVGVVGSSGHGKSSLINSLLDVDSLAMTDSSGSAVTAFVIEYRYSLPEHEANYNIDCTCLDEDELAEQLELLLEDYRNPELQNLDEYTSDEVEKLYNASQAAADTFEAAFANVAGFDLKLLDYDEKDISKASALAYLYTWSKSLQWPQNMVDGVWTAKADYAGECQALIADFQERGVWPFIKRMCIYVKSEILKNGLVLADLPGYHDVNLSRVKAARLYQAKCDDIFVVADIKRAVDNPVVENVIKENKRADPSIGKVGDVGITIVCTHSANLSDKKKLEALVNKEELKRVKANIDALNAQGVASRKEFQEVDHAYDALLISARNAKVVKDLQRKYNADFNPGTLPVFCVDNQMYAEKLCDSSLETSEIPQLREYAEDLPAQALFKAGESFLNACIPALIGSFEIWADGLSIKVAVKDEVYVAPSTTNLRSGPATIASWKSDSSSSLSSHLSQTLKRKSQAISRQALDTAESWRAMHFASVAAWFRNNGTYKTPAAGSRCWNTELIRCSNKFVAIKWDTLDAEMEDSFGELINGLLSSLRQFRSQAATATAPKAFLTSLKGREKYLADKLYNLQDKFMQFFRRIKQDATTGRSTSYIVDYMMPVYHEGACDSGSGVTERRHALIESHVSDPRFVSFQRKSVECAITNLLENTVSKINRLLDETVRAIEDDVKLLCPLPQKEKSLAEKYPRYIHKVNLTLSEVKSDKMALDKAVAPVLEVAETLYITDSYSDEATSD